MTNDASQDNETTAQGADLLPELTSDQLSNLAREAMARAGWQSMMPVQRRAIPYVLAGKDLMVQSRTGSGKTGAFILPILDRINTDLDECQALVMAPTRELAQQVATDAQTLAGDRPVRIISVYGGTSYGPQLDAFKAGAHLVIGTPGRLLDHLLRRSLSLDDLQILVFDEADRLLSMGFYPDMKELQRYLPQRRIDAFMFSATFPPRVMSLARQFLTDPTFLGLSADNVHVAETEHVFYGVEAMDKDRSLVRIIEAENPDSAIIFCNTKNRVHYVSVVLQRFGYDADELSSDLSQKARDVVLNRVRSGKLRFLVATDVAARGIDIPELSHVIQYEPPEDPEIYIHRAGRTGRAGASGVAMSLVDWLEKAKLKRIAQRYEIDLIERQPPTDEDVAGMVSERMTVFLENQLRSRDRLKAERMQRFIPLARSLGEDEDGLEVLAMLLDDAYQITMHPVPEDSAAERSERTRPERESGGQRGGRSRSGGGSRRRRRN